ncbi:prolyl-tRNA editing enzyme YbaK/EbsC (Cys-tRNA(Pro) deacylase) [Propionicimonas paludicola]|uniref:Prolyl-tRNA editing enzyme YbaK/EbsC (Cys-tRNA(Pro) deacylase) n=1 Tax=Propionicimonas paludicola TaxID=185243 RepID=A0A2A9CSN7_9ACTN|nr:YbaK/EbsC family protein [Propionicimonas paludicola]PFG16640.1 prolyl-tRNA editing enzyme YbaK/EbsC (Cys-tRNA(Pro) deacylase) [Propionicimonas paludicola]
MTTADEPIAATTLSAAGLSYRLHRHPPARTEAELHLTGLDVNTSAKTLAFVLPDESVVLAAIPGPARLKYAHLARALGVPRSALRSADPDALAALGMAAGGVSPVCADPAVRVVIHQTLLDLNVLYCGSGSPDSSIEISPATLQQLRSDLLVAELCD